MASLASKLTKFAIVRRVGLFVLSLQNIERFGLASFFRYLSYHKASISRKISGEYKGSKGPVFALSESYSAFALTAMRSAMREGYEVHLISRKPSRLELPWCHHWHKLEAEEDFDEVIRLGQKLGVIAVLIAERDRLVPLQHKVADSLNVKSVGEKAALSSDDKQFMREYIKEKPEVDQLMWMSIEHQNDPAIESMHFPAVFKPVTGTASLGVRKVESIAEVGDAWAELKSMTDVASVRPDKVILEEYINGPQYDVEGVVGSDGELVPLLIVGEDYSDNPPYFAPRLFYFNPPLNDSLREKILQSAVSSVKAAGVVAGAWHCELRLCEDGRVVALDYSNRMGYPDLVSLTSGSDFGQVYVQSMLDEPLAIDAYDRISMVTYYVMNDDELAMWKKIISEGSRLIRKYSFLGFKLTVLHYKGVIELEGTYEEITALFNKYSIDIEPLRRLVQPLNAQ